ncbi:MAG: hypothetical protein SFV54_14375 [Bryobacteraceae bacterium]|nr:hypothetical protein [Bryobacteraceae bacterium]
MRTTITLEPDVQALIRAAMKERGISFKEAVNSAVRAGLTQAKPRRRSFVQKSYSLGREQNFRWDKALEAAAAIEDEELSRKLSLRK